MGYVDECRQVTESFEQLPCPSTTEETFFQEALLRIFEFLEHYQKFFKALLDATDIVTIKPFEIIEKMDSVFFGILDISKNSDEIKEMMQLGGRKSSDSESIINAMEHVSNIATNTIVTLYAICSDNEISGVPCRSALVDEDAKAMVG